MGHGVGLSAWTRTATAGEFHRRRGTFHAAGCVTFRPGAFDAVGDRWGQVVFAPLMMSLSFSVGVCPFKTMRGRRLRRSWMAWTWVSVTSVKLVPLGRYSRIRRLVFSLVGRCQGLWGSAK